MTATSAEAPENFITAFYTGNITSIGDVYYSAGSGSESIQLRHSETRAVTIYARNFSYTLSRDVTPSIMELEILPEPEGIPVMGDVTLSDAAGVPAFSAGASTVLSGGFTFSDCRMVDRKQGAGTSAKYEKIYLADRRWRWEHFGVINVEFNRRDDNGTISTQVFGTPTNLPGVSVLEFDAITSAGSTAKLNYNASDQTLAYQPSGLSGYGTAVDVSAGGQFFINSKTSAFIEDGTKNWVRVYVNPAKLPGTNVETTFTAEAKATAREIGQALLSGLGENASAGVCQGLPTDKFPHFDWQAVPIDDCLQQLCDHYGAHLCLGTDDVFRINAAGSGMDVPDYPFTQSDESHDNLNVPEKIAYVCERKYQKTLSLTAVGQDADGSLIDISLSAGAGGLSYWTSAGFNLATWEGISDQETRKKAKASLFKWYRLPSRVFIDGSWFSRRDAFRRWKTDICSMRTIDGENRFEAPFVTGLHLTPEYLNDPNRLDMSDTDTRVEVPFTIDLEQGLVRFGQPVFWRDANDKMIGATLTMNAAFRGRDHRITLSSGSAQCQLSGASPVAGQIKVLERAEATYNLIETTADTVPGSGVNDIQINTLAQDEIAAAANLYKRADPVQRVYPGLVNLFPDGSIEEVSWRFGVNMPPTTTVCWGSERDPDKPPRRLREHFRAADQTVKESRRDRLYQRPEPIFRIIE